MLTLESASLRSSQTISSQLLFFQRRHRAVYYYGISVIVPDFSFKIQITDLPPGITLPGFVPTIFLLLGHVCALSRMCLIFQFKKWYNDIDDSILGIVSRLIILWRQVTVLTCGPMSAKRKSAGDEAVDGDAMPTKKKKILQSIMKFGRLLQDHSVVNTTFAPRPVRQTSHVHMQG